MLEKEQVYTRVVSMPSMELFDSQSSEYKESVLPRAITKRVSVEMGSSFGWHKYVGLDGKVIGIDTFGASGKASEVMAKFGFTTENIVKIYKSL